MKKDTFNTHYPHSVHNAMFENIHKKDLKNLEMAMQILLKNIKSEDDIVPNTSGLRKLHPLVNPTNKPLAKKIEKFNIEQVSSLAA